MMHSLFYTLHRLEPIARICERIHTFSMLCATAEDPLPEAHRLRWLALFEPGQAISQLGDLALSGFECIGLAGQALSLIGDLSLLTGEPLGLIGEQALLRSGSLQGGRECGLHVLDKRHKRHAWLWWLILARRRLWWPFLPSEPLWLALGGFWLAIW